MLNIKKVKQTLRPTVRALSYAQDLADQLGVRRQYDWNSISKEECAALINRLKAKLNYS
jgi:hypothetical protein